MIRLYTRSVHQAGYETLNRECIKIRYNKTVGTMFAATESEDTHKLPAVFARTSEVFRLD